MKGGAELGRPEGSLPRGGGRASAALRDERARDLTRDGGRRGLGGELDLHVGRRGLIRRGSRLTRGAGGAPLGPDRVERPGNRGRGWGLLEAAPTAGRGGAS